MQTALVFCSANKYCTHIVHYYWFSIMVILEILQFFYYIMYLSTTKQHLSRSYPFITFITISYLINSCTFLLYNFITMKCILIFCNYFFLNLALKSTFYLTYKSFKPSIKSFKKNKNQRLLNNLTIL